MTATTTRTATTEVGGRVVRGYRAKAHADGAPAEIDALFEEAHRRRRRRRSAITASLIVTLAVVASVLFVGGGSGSRGQSHLRSGSSGAAAGPGHATSSRSTPNVMAPVAPTSSYTTGMGVISYGPRGPEVGWAESGLGAFLTTDDGRTWRNITPAALRGQDPGDRDEGITAFGARDLWMPVHDVFGFVSAAQARVTGSVRAQGVFRSTDGGRTWSFAALPGCLQTCGAAIDLDFVSAQEGFALVGPTVSPVLRLFATTDGGATWQQVGEPPFHGDNASIAFASDRDGWAASEPTYGRYASPGGAKVADPGGELFHTTDGGRTWARAKGLPSRERYELPSILGHRTAVVLGLDPRRGRHGAATIYVTSDGGTRWSAHAVPGDSHLVAYLGDRLSVIAPPFSVATPRRWTLFIGPFVYRTDDAGGRWVHTRTTPAWSAGAVLALDIASSGHGWAESYVPNCVPLANVGPCTPVSPPLLEATADGGRTWRPLPFWRPPPNF